DFLVICVKPDLRSQGKGSQVEAKQFLEVCSFLDAYMKNEEQQIEFEEEAGIVQEEDSLSLLETSLPTPTKTGTLSVVLRSYEVNLNVMCS
ncbi:hypothetical protein TNIN_193581, partial [Trichonephila inaurata madagascariensis]